MKKRFLIIASLIAFACAKKQNEPIVGHVETNAPTEVTFLRATSTSTLLELTWIDPPEKDLKEVEILWDNNSYRVLKGNQYFSLENPYLKTYNFRIRTIDDKGNSSYGVPITNKIDYRLKYCGNFKFTQFEWFYAAGDTTFYAPSTYNGYVVIDNYSPDKVIVRYKAGTNVCTCNNDSVYGGYFKPSLSNSGVMAYPIIKDMSVSSDLQGSFLSKDSLSFLFTIESLGNVSGQDVKGKRIN